MKDKFTKTERSLLSAANNRSYRTVIIETGRKIVGHRSPVPYGKQEDKAAKNLVKAGYLKVVLRGTFKSPMGKLNGYCIGTETKYQITKKGQKVISE